MRAPWLALLAAFLPSLIGAEGLPPTGGGPQASATRPIEHRWKLGLAEPYRQDVDSGSLSDSVLPEPDHPAVGFGPGRTLEAPRFSERLRLDFKALAMTPLTVERRGWKRFGAGVALVGVVSLFDDEIHSAMSPGEQGSPVLKHIRPLGEEASFALLGGAWLIGKFTGRQRYKSIARDGLEASIFAAGLGAPLGKSLFGRGRPRDGFDSDDFQAARQSFPSGEATQAFAVAAVVSAHSRRRWVKALSWSLAAGVAWQRVEMNAHWASDVTAGALLGSAMGRWVVRRHRPDLEGRSSWSVAPQVGDGSAGLAVRWSR